MKGLAFFSWTHNKVKGRLGNGGGGFFILDQMDFCKLNEGDLELSKGLYFLL